MFSLDPSNGAIRSSPSTSSGASGRSNRAGTRAITPTGFGFIGYNGMISFPNPFIPVASLENAVANSAIALPTSDENVVPSEAVTTTSNRVAEAPVKTGKCSKKTGRDRGAVTYGADEHIALLSS
jgi:hypothetical protein